MPVKHAFTSPKSDDPDATLVRPSNWNADHSIVDDIEVPRRFAVGTTAAVNTVAVVSSSTAALTTTTQLGVDAICIGTSAATVSIIGARIQVGTAAAAYTAAQVVSLYVKAPTKGTGSTITNYYGFYVEAPTVSVSGDKYHMYFGAISGGVDNGTPYGIYMESISGGGSSLNYAIYTNAGEVRFGDTLTVSLANKRAIAAQSGVLLGTGGTDTLYVQANWNNSGVNFTGMLMEITNTASGVGSLMANWKFASNSVFSVTKTGVLTTAQGIVAGGNSSVTGEFTASGRVAFGTTASQGYAVLIASGPIMQAVSEIGLAVLPVMSSFATTSGTAFYVQLKTVNVTYTMATGYGVRIDTPSKGAANTITTLYGLKIENQTGGGTNYAIWTGVGPIVFGDTVEVDSRLAVGAGAATGAIITASTVNAGLTGTTQYGFDALVTGSSAATTTIAAYRGYAQTANAAYTAATVAVFFARAVVKGTGSTITTVYGLYIEDQTVGATNYAIYTGAGLVRFGGAVTINGGMLIVNQAAGGGIVAIQQNSVDKLFLQWDGTNGLLTTAGALLISAGGSEKWRITTAGKLLAAAAAGIVCANGALGTGSTSGFLYIPSCNGTPNGTPITETGTVPIVYDTSTNKLYAYNGAWKQVTLA